MSYDIYLKINTGKEDITAIDVGNYTSNVGKMYRVAFPADYSGLHGLHDQKAEDTIPILNNAIVEMTENPAVYKAMNPSNGWGDYEGALQYLREILLACENHPACTICLSA